MIQGYRNDLSVLLRFYVDQHIDVLAEYMGILLYEWLNTDI